MVVCFCGRNDVDDVFGDYIPIDINLYIDIRMSIIYTYIWVVLRK